MAARRPSAGGNGTPAWQRRNELARLRGYRSYYHYRTSNYGRIPADAPRPTGESLSRLRGHRSRADLLHALTPGALLSVQQTDRGADGRLTRVALLVIDERGREKVFVLRGHQLDTRQLQQLVNEANSSGAVFAPSPSLDVRRLRKPVWAFQRLARWLVRFTAAGRAVTSPRVADAMIVEGDQPMVEAFLRENPEIRRKGFRPVLIDDGEPS